MLLASCVYGYQEQARSRNQHLCSQTVLDKTQVGNSAWNRDLPLPSSLGIWQLSCPHCLVFLIDFRALFLASVLTGGSQQRDEEFLRFSSDTAQAQCMGQGTEETGINAWCFPQSFVCWVNILLLAPPTF